MKRYEKRFLITQFSLALFFVLSLLQSAFAQEMYDPEIVIAYQGNSVLTQSELDTAFSRVPASDRLEFIRDPDNVNLLIGTLLLNKLLVTEAEKISLEEDPQVSLRLQLAREQELALAWKEYILTAAPEADYESMAYESYIADPSSFQTAESIDVSHILIKTDKRSTPEARELATDIRKQILEAPGRFDDLVSEYSEDSGKDSNGGRYPEVTRGQMVRQFERAAFALEEPGELSEPVKSKFGFHVIRLNGRNEPEQIPFDQVSEKLVEEARTRHALKYRDTYIGNLVKEPIGSPPGALKNMVKRHFGENLELAPDIYGQIQNNKD